METKSISIPDCGVQVTEETDLTGDPEEISEIKQPEEVITYPLRPRY
jgi:hypothetical protein